MTNPDGNPVVHDDSQSTPSQKGTTDKKETSTSGSQQSQRPAPRPGPRPGPKPGQQVAQRKPVAPVATPPKNKPELFGRVDADGTAWVKTNNGERQIGEFKAGTPEEGLAHFGSRYDDLSTEIAVLENRLLTHPEEAARIRTDAQSLQESLTTAAVIGDLAALEDRLDAIAKNSIMAEQKVAEDKQKRKEEAIAAKEALAKEAEELSESSEWKSTGDRFRALMDQWKAVRGVPRAKDDELWERFSSARDAFNKRRNAHFADLDKNRALAKSKKETLVEQAEALSDSTDWNTTAREYKALMQEWKAAGRAPREIDDQLWERFRAAQDKFFDARTADNDKRDAEFADNATAKQQLIDEYDAKINPESEGLEKSRSALRELQDKWENIGFVPRNRVREFEDKIKALENRVSEAEEAQWRKTDPEAQARVAQFQAKADQFAAEAEAASSKGNSAKATKLREQAEQWQEWAQTAASALEG